MENMLLSTVPNPQILTYESSGDPQSTSDDSSEEILTPKVNPTPRNNPPNTVPNIPDEPDSDLRFSDSSFSD